MDHASKSTWKSQRLAGPCLCQDTSPVVLAIPVLAVLGAFWLQRASWRRR